MSCDVDYFLGQSLAYKVVSYPLPHLTHPKVNPSGIKIWNECSLGEVCVEEASLISENILNFTVRSGFIFLSCCFLAQVV